MPEKKQKITLDMKGDNRQLNAALDRTQAELKEVSDFAKKAGLDLKQAAASSTADWTKLGMGIASWGHILAKVGGYIGELATRFSDMAKEAQGLHTTAEGLQRLDKASRESGNSTEILRDAYSRFYGTLVSAQRGSAKAQKQLAALGLTAQELGTDGEEAFLKAAQALTEMGAGTERNEAQMKLFGDSTERLAAALAQAAANGKSMDGIVKEADVQRMADMAAAWSSIKDSLGNMAAFYLSKPMGAIADLFDTASGGFYKRIQAESEKELAEYESMLRKEEEARERSEKRKRQIAIEENQRKLEEIRRQEREQEELEAQAFREQTKRDEDKARREEEIRRAGLTDYERWLEDRFQAWKDAQKNAGMTADEADNWIDTVWDKQHTRPGEMTSSGKKLKADWDYLQRIGDKEKQWYAETAKGARDAAAAQRDLNQATSDYRPPRERNQFFTDRASRRFADAGEARERARDARARADDLNRQARTAKAAGNTKEARQLMSEAADYERQYERSLKYSRKVRRRAKKDEKASYGAAAGAGAASASGQIDYTGRLDGIITAIGQLKANTYIVK